MNMPTRTSDRQAEAGELDFLQKPFPPSALLHTARRVLERDGVKT